MALAPRIALQLSWSCLGYDLHDYDRHASDMSLLLQPRPEALEELWTEWVC